MKKMTEITLEDFLKGTLSLPEKIWLNSSSAAREIEKVTEEFRHQLKLYLFDEIRKDDKK
jgi:hypothetical protein